MFFGPRRVNLLTPEAQVVLNDATEEARRFNHEFIGTEHILLGLINDRSEVATGIRRRLDADLQKIRLDVEKIVQTGRGGDQVVLSKLPYTPRAKKTIEFAVKAAGELDHTYVGPEHLFLGLLREPEGVAAIILNDAGVVVDDVLASIKRELAELARWRTSDVIGLARGIIADSAFDRLPILADALMDAGCEDPGMLAHLHRGTDHGCGERGCWVVDRLLAGPTPRK